MHYAWPWSAACWSPSRFFANASKTIIVGRGASADGSRIFGRLEDNQGLAVKKLELLPAASGEADIPFTDANTGLTLSLPGLGVGYLCIPEAQALNQGRGEEAGVNTHGVGLTATDVAACPTVGRALRFSFESPPFFPGGLFGLCSVIG